MHLGSMFISNCNNALHVSDAFCVHPQVDGFRHQPWTPLLDTSSVSCHTPEAVTTVFKCSWGWTQKASETCRAVLQLLINILPRCTTLVF